MREGRASATAYRVAMRRAAHQILDEPRVLEDSVALRIVGDENAAALRADAHRTEADALSRGLRAFLVARSRYAEDELGRAVQDGVRQYVVLGAGLDTFAYRNPHPSLRVFEVDHPATQAWKRDRLDEAGIPVPASLTWAAVDFETQTLADELPRTGFDPGAASFFSWLGVTPYLARETVHAMLRFLASSVGTASRVVFDYATEPSLLDARLRSVFDLLASRVAAAGEPWLSSFDPASLAADLGAMGFGNVHDVGPDELNARYFAGRADGLRVGGFGRLMHARI